MDPSKSQLYQMGYGRVDFGANLNPPQGVTNPNQMGSNLQNSMQPGNQQMSYANMLPLLYQSQLMGLGLQPQLFYNPQLAAALPSAVFNPGQFAQGLGALPNNQNGLNQSMGGNGSLQGGQSNHPGMGGNPYLSLLPQVGTGIDSKGQVNSGYSQMVPQMHGHSHGFSGQQPQKQGYEGRDFKNKEGQNTDREWKEGGDRFSGGYGRNGRVSQSKDNYTKHGGRQGEGYNQAVDPSTGRLHHKDHPGEGYQAGKQRKEQELGFSDQYGKKKPEKFREEGYREEFQRPAGNFRDKFKDERSDFKFQGKFSDGPIRHQRREDDFKYGQYQDRPRRDSREREKERFRDKDFGGRDYGESRERDRFRDKEQNYGRDFDRNRADRGRDRFNDRFDRHPHYDDNKDFKDFGNRKQRFDDKLDHKRHNKPENVPKFMIISKPMDNIEGNSIPKDRPVTYMCFDSNVPRRATVLDMVKFKIGKYFTPEASLPEQDAKPAEEEHDEFGLSDEDDLYYLTFKSRYYSEFIICQNCFKEGRSLSSRPRRKELPGTVQKRVLDVFG